MTMILRIATPSPLRQLFDYKAPLDCDVAKLVPGIRVKVPWRSKTCVGILMEVAKSSTVAPSKLKRAEAILDTEPVLSPHLLKLITWAAEYYQHPIGDVILSCLPTLLRQGRKIETPPIDKQTWHSIAAPNVLNSAQEQALVKINSANGFNTFLIDGVTGSGKTEIYLHAIAKQLAAGKQALVLVPEIGLTPQTVARFKERFNAPIAILHSGLTDKERLSAWQQAKSGEAAIIIGTRSAIFTPLLNPGMIILDEEHDLSFKQQSGFRYSARDLAIVRAQLENIPVLLGSATPSLESHYNVAREKYHYLSLPERAGNAIKPKFHIIDIRQQYLEEGLSKELLTAMQQHLQREGQVLLFLNRRGFAPVLLCHDCGWMAQCPRCDARLTMHQQPKKLVCHHCDTQQVIPKKCPTCQSDNLLMLGLGTERLEAALGKHFPNIAITRIDRDTTRRKGSMQQKLDAINSGTSKILIGTQMLTKGHHFPDVTLVGIINADNYLYSSDFRASERLGQLVTQVAGRAGRAEKPGEVMIQTHFPDHRLLLDLVKQDYATFAKDLLQERQITQLPPFTYMALLRAEAITANAPNQFLQAIANTLKNPQLQLLGPIPAPMERKAGVYRAQLFIKSKQRQSLQRAVKHLLDFLQNQKNNSKVRWSIDIDPAEIY